MAKDGTLKFQILTDFNTFGLYKPIMPKSLISKVLQLSAFKTFISVISPCFNLKKSFKTIL